MKPKPKVFYRFCLGEMMSYKVYTKLSKETTFEQHFPWMLWWIAKGQVFFVNVFTFLHFCFPPEQEVEVLNSTMKPALGISGLAETRK